MATNNQFQKPPITISNFLASFTKDVARTSRFDVTITPPDPLLSAFGGNALSTQLSFRCESTEMPGKTYVIHEQKFGSNPTEKFPYLHSYQDVSMTFIVSDDMFEKYFFDSWMEQISSQQNYNFQYKSQYAALISISQYDLNGNLTYQVQLNDAFPVAVNQLDMDWTSDAYHKLSVVFTYTDWQILSQKSLPGTFTGQQNVY